MSVFIVKIREQQSGEILAAQQLSGDAGALQRRRLAEHLARRVRASLGERDLYAVELESSNVNLAINKYEV